MSAALCFTIRRHSIPSVLGESAAILPELLGLLRLLQLG
jgi:hypothetical protein